MKDYYKLLGIDSSADESTIKRAYRKLAKECHPDAKPGDKEAEKRFKELSEAYSVLSDKEKKKEYDKERNGGSSTWTHAWKGYEDIFKSGSYERYSDMYEELFKGMFSNMGNYTDIKVPSKGKDIESSISISFMESVSGCQKKIRAGNETSENFVDVTIPAGVEQGEKIRVTGSGGPGINGGKNGDLILEIRIEKDPYFTRKGKDIFSTIRIPFSMAMLGGSCKVRTLTSNVMLNIGKRTKPGIQMKLKGKGINGGDHYVEIQIDIPKEINLEQEQLLMELQKHGL